MLPGAEREDKHNLDSHVCGGVSRTAAFKDEYYSLIDLLPFHGRDSGPHDAINSDILYRYDACERSGVSSSIKTYRST